MCDNCYSMEQLFKANRSNPNENLNPTFRFIECMFNQNRLLHYAGDCIFSETLRLAEREEHFTYSHYIECSDCHQIYFFGICIRGTPIYKKIENVNKEKIERLLWGSKGFYFRS